MPSSRTKKIVFVDDDENILDSLRRMLRRQRSEWDMTFVEDGGAALDLLEGDRFDVIVSDMRMPGMGGAELLRQVQDSFPDTIRIVLSGYSELETALRAVPVAHHFLTKPCEPDVLTEAVQRACDLQAQVNDCVLVGAVGSIGELPKLPSVYNSLVATLVNPNSSLDEIADVVEKDRDICQRILSFVNLRFFDIEVEITNIRQATTYLGVNMLKVLTLAMEVFKEFEREKSSARFSVEAEQSHSTMTGRIAWRLLKGKRSAEDAFVAAMLHDIGKLLFATKLPSTYARVIAMAERTGRTLHDVEKELYGVTHAQVGGYLLSQWGMPYSIVEAVINHHTPSKVASADFDILGAVHVADALAYGLSFRSHEDESILDLEYLEKVGMAHEIDKWREVAHEEREVMFKRADVKDLE